MEFKSNINKIHSDLLANFGDVQIVEKSSLEFGEYFEIRVNEDSKQLLMVINKRVLESTNFNWMYYANPNEMTSPVERNSNVSDVIEDVKDIFEKNRFDSDYLQKLN